MTIHKRLANIVALQLAYAVAMTVASLVPGPTLLNLPQFQTASVIDGPTLANFPQIKLPWNPEEYAHITDQTIRMRLDTIPAHAHFAVASNGNRRMCVFDTPMGGVKCLYRDVGHGVCECGSVPFAQPFSTTRFAAPLPATPWGDHTLDATRGPSAGCMQVNPAYSFPAGLFVNLTNGVSEDCGTMTIYVPANINPERDSVPVYVFLHGGGFTAGAGAGVFDGAYLANQTGMIVVEPEYRPGLWGFAHVAGDTAHPYNVGLMDQKLSLEFVSDNIAAFGGDDSSMTLAGQSAGAMSVLIQASTPADHDPNTNYLHYLGFDKLHVQSPAQPVHVSLATMDGYTTQLLTQVGCATSPPATAFACLATKDPATLLAAQSALGLTFAPAVGAGTNMPAQISTLVSDMVARERDRHKDKRFKLWITRVESEAGEASNYLCCGISSTTLFGGPVTWDQPTAALWAGVFIPGATPGWSSTAASEALTYYQNPANGYLKSNVSQMTSNDWYQLQFKSPVADSFVHADFWLWSEVTSVLRPHLSNFTYHWQNTTYPQAAIENGHGSDATALFQVPSQPYEQASLTDTDHQMCQEYARNVRAFADGTGLSWATYPKVRIFATPGRTDIGTEYPRNINTFDTLWAPLEITPPTA